LKGDVQWASWVSQQLGGVKAPVSVPATACARVHRYRSGNSRFLAFERNINYQMSEELKQAGGNEALEHAQHVEAKLPQRSHVYDLRTGEYLGQVDKISFELDPWKPSLFALTDKAVEGGIVEALGKE
jgi:hypothetical protein